MHGAARQIAVPSVEPRCGALAISPRNAYSGIATLAAHTACSATHDTNRTT